MTNYLVFLVLFVFSLLSFDTKALNAGSIVIDRSERLNAFPEIEQYVQKIGYKIAKVSDYPDLPYRFIIINNSIPNAYSFPSGDIVITRGFLLKIHNEAELASVLAHEIGHQTSFQKEKIRKGEIGAYQTTLAAELTMTTENLSDVLDRIAMRADEYEADKYGLHYLANAGYDVHAAIELQKHFLLHNTTHNEQSFFEHLFDTHPYPQSRIEANMLTASSLASNGNYLGADEFKNVMQPLHRAETAYRYYDEGQEAYQKGNFKVAYTYANQAIQAFDKEPLFYGLLEKISEKLHS